MKGFFVKFKFIVGFLLFLPLLLCSQDLMRPPLNGRLVLTGSYAEYRRNHYHSGIDYRTKDLPDRKIYSVEKGYIRRIKISPAGYGRAIYIAHPNGLTSVYGHLDGFSARIDTLVRKIQYCSHSFNVDTIFTPGQFAIDKGEVLGIAGNAGFSFGEHLHFELRDTETDDPINPYPLYLEVYDTVSPSFQWLKILEDMSMDAVFTKDTLLDLRRSKIIGKVISVSDTFALTMGISDYSARYSGLLIPYSIRVSIDNKPQWEIVFDRYAFKETLMCRASFEFAEDKKSKREMISTYSIYSKELPFIRRTSHNGSFILGDDSIHTLSIKTLDYGGNESNLFMKIKRKKNKAASISYAPLLKADSSYTFQDQNFEIFLQSGTLTDHLYLSQPFVQFFTTPKAFLIGNEYFGILKPITVFADQWGEKIILAKMKSGEIEETFSPTINSSGRKKVEISECGYYQLIKDTLAPQILKTNIALNGLISKLRRLEFIVTDNSTKISSFSALANGKWILMEYDLKYNLFTIARKDLPATPEIQLIIEFSDKSGNTFKKEFLLKQ